MNIIFFLIVDFMKTLERKHSKHKIKENIKLDLSNKNNEIEDLRKIFEQGTIDSLKTLGKFIRRAFELRNFECQQCLSYTSIL